MTNSQKNILLALGIALFIATIAVHLLWSLKGAGRLTDRDIYYVWEEGKKLANGINPYARIIGNSIRDNDKYPTYLPLSYYAVAIFDRLGIKEFDDFVKVWRLINLFCHLCIGILIINVYKHEHKIVSGLVACGILLLGRWSSYIINVQHLEFIAILPILLAGHQLQRKPKLSALLFGLSLSVKHVGIILLPSFLIELNAKLAPKGSTFKRKQILIYSLIALGIPLVISLPFLLDQPLGFTLNMLFSATRDFGDHGKATGTRIILTGVDGTRLLMVALIVINWLAQAKEKVNFWHASTVTLLLFLQFNAVIFAQYYIWLAAFLVISFAYIPSRSNGELKAERSNQTTPTN